MKLTNNRFTALQGGFADKLVLATGKTAEETREVVTPKNTLNFLSIEVIDDNNQKTDIEILVQPDMELITAAVQYRMSNKFYITFDAQYNRWVEKRATPNQVAEDTEESPF